MNSDTVVLVGEVSTKRISYIFITVQHIIFIHYSVV